MNWDQVKGNWTQFQGKVKEKWGQITDDDLTAINGRREQLAGKLQERYGYEKERAERERGAARRPSARSGGRKITPRCPFWARVYFAIMSGLRGRACEPLGLAVSLVLP